MNLREPPIMSDKPELSIWLNELRHLLNDEHSSIAADILAMTTAIYFGEPGDNDTWRLIRSGNKLSVERRESGSWVSKFRFVT